MVKQKVSDMTQKDIQDTFNDIMLGASEKKAYQEVKPMFSQYKRVTKLKDISISYSLYSTLQES